MDPKSIPTGGPAFPDCNSIDSQGMTLRDYFATAAMQGFAADPEASWPDGVRGMARGAYKWADAMLEARKT